ncbi:MAG: adenylosuccinate synthase [Candidatus Bathyarchaeota archaeon]
MPCTVIVGTQFGDEGKGKVVDYYSGDMDIIIRYNGGANAGHTVVIGKEEFTFQLLPSGVLRKDKTVIIGNGVVLEPELLLSEIEHLKSRGVIPAKIFISDRTHVVLPYHKMMDEAQERFKGNLRAGSTKRGIGPSYSDKVARFGIRICDLLDEKVLSEKLDIFVPLQKKLLAAYGENVEFSIIDLKKQCLRNGENLRPYVTDTLPLLHQALLNEKKILLEGAQGTHLDIDWGIYPFGTSSNAVSGGACTGSGIPPTKIDRVIGIVKAYTSRVGEGPFPTELEDEVGNYLRNKGGEYGTVTHRPRRIGWLDVVMLNYSVRVNGVSAIALTKVDVLSGLEKIKVCMSYKYGDKEVVDFPANMNVLSECQPIYETLDGWDDCSKAKWSSFAEKGYDSLPKNLRSYVEYIEEVTKVPVNLISFGPERALTIERST